MGLLSSDEHILYRMKFWPVLIPEILLLNRDCKNDTPYTTGIQGGWDQFESAWFVPSQRGRVRACWDMQMRAAGMLHSSGILGCSTGTIAPSLLGYQLPLRLWLEDTLKFVAKGTDLSLLGYQLPLRLWLEDTLKFVAKGTDLTNSTWHADSIPYSLLSS